MVAVTYCDYESAVCPGGQGGLLPPCHFWGLSLGDSRHRGTGTHGAQWGSFSLSWCGLRASAPCALSVATMSRSLRVVRVLFWPQLLDQVAGDQGGSRRLLPSLPGTPRGVRSAAFC